MPDEHDLTISVVIPTYGRDAAISKLVPELNGSDNCDEIIVVGSNLRQDTIKHISNYCKFVRGPGEGPVEAKRLGVDKAKGDIIGFFDDDIRVSDGYFGGVKEQFANGEEIVQTKLVFEDKGKTPIDNNTGNISSYKWNALLETNFNYGSETQYIPYGNENGLFVLKEVLDEVPLFDGNLIGSGYGESISFAFRAQSEGYRICFYPDSILYHVGEDFGGNIESSDKISNSENNSSQSCGKYHYELNHNMLYIHTVHYPHLAIPAYIYHTFRSLGRAVYYRDISCVPISVSGVIHGMLTGLKQLSQERFGNR